MLLHAFELGGVREPLVVQSRRGDRVLDGMSKSITFTTTHRTVLMIVRPPGLPVTSTGLPSFSTITGVMELSIRLPGAIWFGFGADLALRGRSRPAAG